MLKGILALVLLTSTAHAVTETELENQARKEGVLNLYTNHLLYGDVLAEHFGKKYPFIQIKHRKFPPATDAYDFFENENPELRADVVLRCQQPTIGILLELNYLARIDNLPNWEKRSKIPEQSPYYHNFLGAPHVIIYNPELVAEKDLPQSYDDLLDPKWKGKVAMRSPRRGNSPDFFVSYIRKTRGLDWFVKFAQNKPIITQSGDSVHELVETGSYAIGLSRDLEALTHMRDFQARTGKASKIRVKFLENDRPHQYQLMTMNSKAPHDGAARLFMNWLLSDEARELMHGKGFAVGARLDDLLKHKSAWQWNMATDNIGMNEFTAYLAKVIRLLKANGATMVSPKGRRN